MRASAKSASGGQPLTPPYLVLHREEFAWPRMSPHAPVRSYRTVSPITSLINDRRGWFVFCCTCRRPACQISRFKPPDAPPLAGSLPCGVRTFLSRLSPAATARPVLLQGEADYSKGCSTGIVSA